MRKIEITDADVDQWRNEAVELEKKIRELQSKKDRLLSKVNAVRLFLPEDPKEEAQRSTAKSVGNVMEPQMSLPAAVRTILKPLPGKFDKLLLRGEVMKRGIPEKKLGTRYSYFYAVVAKMENAGEIVHDKRGRLTLREGNGEEQQQHPIN